jgi:hypothetical protein
MLGIVLEKEGKFSFYKRKNEGKTKDLLSCRFIITKK